MVPYAPDRLDPTTQRKRGEEFLGEMDRRRSVRFFSDDAVPLELIELAVKTASTAPSGAHMQPWSYVVTGDPEVKRLIREAAEEEERINYEGGRLPPHWREDLEPLGTDWRKPFLETVPWIVVLFEQRYRELSDGERGHVYYPKEDMDMAAPLIGMPAVA
jgi:iodotyrosine deiodinase